MNRDILTHTLFFSKLNDFENLTRVNKESFNHIKSLPEDAELSKHKQKLAKKVYTIHKIHTLKVRTHDEIGEMLDEFVKNLDEDMTDDIDVMMEVVKKNGRFLSYASTALKANPELVLTAVKNGRALHYASEDCCANPEIALAAVKNSREAYNFISPTIRNEEMRHIAKNSPKLKEGWKEYIRSWVDSEEPIKLDTQGSADISIWGVDIYYKNLRTRETCIRRPVAF